MNKNLKKIMLTTMFSVASISAIGLGQQSKIMAQNENHLHKNIAAKTIGQAMCDAERPGDLAKYIIALRSLGYNAGNIYTDDVSYSRPCVVLRSFRYVYFRKKCIGDDSGSSGKCRRYDDVVSY